MGGLRTWAFGASVALLLALSWVDHTYASETDDEELPTRRELFERLKRVEARNDALEEKVQSLQNGERAPSGDAVRDSVDDYLDGEETGEDEDDGELGLGLVLRRGSILVTIQGFGDVGFTYQSPPRSGRARTAFVAGSAALFGSAQVGEHLQMLTETIVEFHGDENDSLELDQERLWISWSFSDGLTIKFGLEHSPISRWNQLYHHGRYLEVSVERPFLARFESAGILPMHNSGIELSGTLSSGAGLINYVVIVSNGRGKVATDPQKISDRNDEKALDVGLGLIPSGLDTLHIGIHFRIDDVPADPDVAARNGEIRQLIWTAHVEYRGERLEILAEFAYLENRDRLSGMKFRHRSFYVLILYRLNDRWTPYTIVDYRGMDRGDPYFSGLNRDLDGFEHVIGLRFDFANNAALKIEIRWGRAERRNSEGVVTRGGTIGAGVQVSWVF